MSKKTYSAKFINDTNMFRIMKNGQWLCWVDTIGQFWNKTCTNSITLSLKEQRQIKRAIVYSNEFNQKKILHTWIKSHY